MAPIHLDSSEITQMEAERWATLTVASASRRSTSDSRARNHLQAVRNLLTAMSGLRGTDDLAKANLEQIWFASHPIGVMIESIPRRDSATSS